MEYPTSKEQYAGNYDAFGYNEERSRLHDRILDEMFASAESSASPNTKRPPVYMALWGGPNSAKSVVVEILKNRGAFPSTPVIFNMESFAQVPEFKERINESPHPEKAPFLRQEYYDLMMKAVMRAQKERLSIVLDDHGDEVGEYKRHLAFIKESNGRLAKGSLPTENILLGQAMEPNYFMWRLENMQHGIVPENTPWAVQLNQKLSQTWDKLVPMFDFAVLNETTLNLKKKVQRIGVYEKGKATQLDKQRFAEAVTAWKGTNPDARGSSDLWPERIAPQFANIRRGVGYSRDKTGESAEATPKARITSSGSVHSRMIGELAATREPRQVIISSAPFERDNMGDVTYSKRLAEELRGIGEEAAYIRGLTSEKDIFSFMDSIRHASIPQILHLIIDSAANALSSGKLSSVAQLSKTNNKQILSLQLRFPSSGAVISPEGLKTFGAKRNNYTVVTLHEYTILRPEYQAKTLEYLKAADHVVFTTQQEMDAVLEDYAQKFGSADELQQKTTIIPGMYTAPVSKQTEKEAAARPKDVVCFGAMRWRRGIDKAIELAKMMKEDPATKDKTVHIIGTVANEYVVADLLCQTYGKRLVEERLFHWPEGELQRRIDDKRTEFPKLAEPQLIEKVVEDYYTKKYNITFLPLGDPRRAERTADFPPFVELKNLINELNREGIKPLLPIKIHAEPSDAELMKCFEQATYAYVPLDRGADHRSGSVPGLMANNLVTITTQGDFTPDAMKHGAAIFTQDARETMAIIKAHDNDPRMNASTRKKGMEYAESLSPAENARMYRSVYDAVIQEKDKKQNVETMANWQTTAANKLAAASR